MKDLYAYYHKKHYSYENIVQAVFEEKILFVIFWLAN